MMTSPTDRKSLRDKLRQQRLALSDTERQDFSQIITKKIIALPEFQQSQHLSFYLANDGEINPAFIFNEAEKLKKHCYLPVLDTQQHNHLAFYTYRTGDLLKKNRFHIGEPDIQTQQSISAPDLDIVFLPLVGFDQQGNRLGRGAGFYDRTFAFLLNSQRTKPILIGLAYEFQKIAMLTAEKWDVPLNIIVTEKNIYRVD